MTPSKVPTGVGNILTKILLTTLLGVTLTGCGTMNYSSGWERGGQLLSQGPDFKRPGQEANYNGDVKTANGTVLLGGNTYVYSRVGNSYAFIQGSKSK